MGPTTAALLRFFRADQVFTEARHKLEAATKNVRIQQGKAEQLKADHDAAHTAANHAEAKGREVEGDLKQREARIELLRERQTNATNPKEYQALIVEINTQKLDKSKLEEQALAHMEQAETHKKTAADLKAKYEVENAKYAQMSGDIDQRVKELTGQMEALRAPRDEAAAAIPHGARAAYDRAAARYDGEAMAAIEKPDPRDQEYLCTGCNTYLVADIYNRLKSAKDDIVTCPSCQRVLYVPEEMTPELALSKKAARGDAKPPKVKKEKKPVDPNAPKKVRAPRVKKEKLPPAEPGSVAAALAAGAASASGKGPKDMTKPTSAPPSTTHAGMVHEGDEQPAAEPEAPVEASDVIETTADANGAQE